ncbi:MAG: hypothetical protein HQL51_16425 [Magnetococcales bacterium]|nr:hypothetical protein [Magnetococcales bacterium]
MGQILVRSVDDEVLAILRMRAAIRKVSMEQQIREILAEAARPDAEELVAEAEAIAAMSRPSKLPPAEFLIREDRDAEDDPYR